MFRPQAHSGVWASFLIPLALITSRQTSDLEIVSAWLSVYLAVISLSVSYRLYRHYFSLRDRIPRIIYDLLWKDSVCLDFIENRQGKPSGEVKPSKIVDFRSRLYISVLYSNLLYFFGPPSLISFSFIVVTLPFLHIYPIVLSKLFSSCPGSFTFGEGAIVLQACVIFLYKQVLDILWRIEDPTTPSGSVVIIGRAGLFTVLLWLIVSSRKSMWFNVTGIFVISGGLLPYLWIVLKRNPILWAISYVSTVSKLSLIGFWTLCILTSIVVVGSQISKGNQATTATRKYFHGLISAVYLVGIFVDEDLLYLASLVALAFFLILEFLRIHRIEPFGRLLDYYFKIFLDEKDGGVLVLTNIYLLTGCSLPLWLHSSNDPIIKLSGVLSIGIGDSFASVLGYKFGRLKWFFNKKKTIEGSLASLISQLAVIFILQRLNLCSGSLWTYLFPISAGVLAEAVTNQVDNLVIPLIVFILANLTSNTAL